MKKILLLTAMIVAGMMTTSCSSDNDGVELQPNNDAGVIALKAEVVPMNTLQEGERTDTRSRVISAEFENTINNIHIVVFGSDGKKIKHFYSPMYVDNPYTTLLNIGSSHAGETVTIYAIANVGDADMFENLENDEYKNLPFSGMFSSNSSNSQSFVTLHLPLPVMRSFLPSLSFFSTIQTEFPPSDAFIAAIIPAGPPPITTVLKNSTG